MVCNLKVILVTNIKRREREATKRKKKKGSRSSSLVLKTSLIHKCRVNRCDVPNISFPCSFDFEQSDLLIPIFSTSNNCVCLSFSEEDHESIIIQADHRWFVAQKYLRGQFLKLFGHLLT